MVTLIGDRKVLLLLDNLEQIVAAAPDVAELVERCPELRIVATSRMPLRIAGEHEYHARSTRLPGRNDLPVRAIRPARCSSSGERRGSFEFTPENAEAVTEVCRRLDGLPLALELAAARLRLLAPEALRDRLDHALELLDVGRAGQSRRQQTLRATIDWSYSLLDGPEQRVFRRLAVFAGGCTLADAEAVCGAPARALDELESLVDAALVQAERHACGMLQTIAEFAREQLDGRGRSGRGRAAPRPPYAEVACEIRDGIEGTEQLAAVERGIREEENLQAALDTLLAAARAGDGDATERGLQMSGDLWMYWHVRGKNLTARDYAAAFLERRAGTPSVGPRRRADHRGTRLLDARPVRAVARRVGRGHRIAAAIGAERELCIAAFARALALMILDPASGLRWQRRPIERGRAAWLRLGRGDRCDGHRDAGHGHWRDARRCRRGFPSARDPAAPRRLGRGRHVARRPRLARRPRATRRRRSSSTSGLLPRSRRSEIEARRPGSSPRWPGRTLGDGDPALARGHFLESVQAHTDVASVRGVGLSLIGLAATEALEDRPEERRPDRRGRGGATPRRRASSRLLRRDPGREFVDQARAALSADEIARATEAGRRLTISEALALATP